MQLGGTISRMGFLRVYPVGVPLKEFLEEYANSLHIHVPIIFYFTELDVPAWPKVSRISLSFDPQTLWGSQLWCCPL